MKKPKVNLNRTSIDIVQTSTDSIGRNTHKYSFDSDYSGSDEEEPIQIKGLGGDNENEKNVQEYEKDSSKEETNDEHENDAIENSQNGNSMAVILKKMRKDQIQNDKPQEPEQHGANYPKKHKRAERKREQENLEYVSSPRKPRRRKVGKYGAMSKNTHSRPPSKEDKNFSRKITSSKPAKKKYLRKGDEYHTLSQSHSLNQGKKSKISSITSSNSKQKYQPRAYRKKRKSSSDKQPQYMNMTSSYKSKEQKKYVNPSVKKKERLRRGSALLKDKVSSHKSKDSKGKRPKSNYSSRKSSHNKSHHDESHQLRGKGSRDLVLDEYNSKDSEESANPKHLQESKEGRKSTSHRR